MATITNNVTITTVALDHDVVVAESLFLGNLPQRQVADHVIVTIDHIDGHVTVVAPTRHETDESYGGTVEGKGWKHYYVGSTFSVDVSDNEEIRQMLEGII